ncbi:tyrosine-type recombinase/integrase [Pseudactinotalea sp.]|uniref:tyrosine-type recombinase/integrase n=1 Tax=Pseudactinotalea sp. TaxID=1926260 RepID=UPI003B3BC8D8
MRGKGEGSVFKDQRTGLWTGVIELPSLNGARRRKKIRRKSKKDLLAAMAAAKAELQRLGDLPTVNQTVAQWFGYWLKQVAKEVRPNTFDGYKRTVENHIVPTIGTVKLDKLTAVHIRRVHDAVLAKGLSSTTALLAHRTMSVSFKMAVREGRIGRNPAALVSAPRKAAVALEPLNLQEALQFLSHASRDDEMGARWATSLLTGARRGEVIGLELDRVGDVLDLSWQLLRLKKTDTDGKPDVPTDYEYRHLTGGLYLTRPKSSKSWRIIPLIDPLKSILEQHIERSPENPWGLVFTKNGRPIGPDADTKAWRKAIQAAGIEKNARLHDARHTAVDLLYAAGVPEDLIQEIVGHSDRATTQGYKSLRNRERLTAAMVQFSALFTPPETEHTREIAS